MNDLPTRLSNLTMNTITATLVFAFTLILSPCAEAQNKPVPKDIKSYCLDFNWAQRGGFAEPGTWNEADPAATVQWHKTIGSNVIQTFCVSTNGYAWYKNGVVPEQPGLKHDFLRDVVKLGHAEGMLVMGYFCISANTRWGVENPELSYGTPSKYHIPYTDEYLRYLSAHITHEDDLPILTIRNPYQSGRCQLKRTGEDWPDSIVVRLLRRNAEQPGPTHFRVANGKVGVWISQVDETKVAAGRVEGKLSLREVWTAGKFLNGGHPESPVELGKLSTRITDEFVEIEIPKLITQENPEMLAFEWCNGEKVR